MFQVVEGKCYADSCVSQQQQQHLHSGENATNLFVLSEIMLNCCVYLVHFVTKWWWLHNLLLFNCGCEAVLEPFIVRDLRVIFWTKSKVHCHCKKVLKIENIGTQDPPKKFWLLWGKCVTSVRSSTFLKFLPSKTAVFGHFWGQLLVIWEVKFWLGLHPVINSYLYFEVLKVWRKESL